MLHRFAYVLALALGGLFIVMPSVAQQQVPKGQFLSVDRAIYEAPSTDARGKQPTFIVFSEDFEGDVSDWTVEGSWAIGAPTAGPDTAYQATSAAGTNLDGVYGNGANERLVSPSFTIPESAIGATLSFYEWVNMESCCDRGRLEVSTDDGSTWTEITQRTGVSEWNLTSANLGTYAGQTVRLGFRLTSDGSVTGHGWFVDQIRVQYEEPDPLSVDITSLNAQSFPDVVMSAVVDTFGVGISTLTTSNFVVMENGVTQTELFEVTPPDVGGGVRRADIVFVVDDTGSMGGEIASVRNNIIDFADQLEGSGIDFALGLVTFKDDVTLVNGSSLTQDVDQFKGWVENLVANGGGDNPENAFGAAQVAASALSYRPASQRVMILITDIDSQVPPAPSHVTPDPPSQSELIDNLNEANITCYAVAIENSQYAGVGSISEETGGRFFFVTSPFSVILDDIADTVGSSYIVRYRTSNPALDGVEREVVLSVSYAAAVARDTAYYRPGATPEIERTAATVDLSSTSWAEGTTFEIEATITDEVEPFLQSASLFYKNTAADSYAEIEMTLISGTTYRGVIPGAAVTGPGLDYYITATDGAGTTSNPTNNPASNPHQIAILPNVAPSISHAVVATASAMTALTITAQVTDNTNALASVQLFYRRVGQFTYTEVPMTLSSGTTYTAEIPGEVIGDVGAAYYIRATDDFGVSASVGSADDPIEAIVPAEEICGDVSGDGTVAAFDGSLALRSAIGTVGLSAFAQRMCDVSGNGECTAYDAAWILQFDSSLREASTFRCGIATKGSARYAASAVEAEWGEPQRVGDETHFALTLRGGETYAMYLDVPGLAGVDGLPPNWQAAIQSGKGALTGVSAFPEDVTVTVRIAGAPDALALSGATLRINEQAPTPLEAGEVTTELALRSLYPNPSAGVVHVQYSLAQAGPVRIVLYDALGRERGTLIDRVQEAGAHTAQWGSHATETLPSGVYFVRLEAEGQALTERLILAR